MSACIDTGKDVYCEWPLGVSIAEARSLRELAQTSGVHTVVGLQARLMPAVRRARALVAGGMPGRIRHRPNVVKPAPDQVLVVGRLLSGASLSAQFLLGVLPPHVPLLTIMGTRGSLSPIASTPDGQLQMSAITLLLGLLPSPLAPVPIEPVSPADSLPATPAGVARMYEAIRDRDREWPDFGHGVRLHELLDAVTEAAYTGQRARAVTAVGA